MNTKHTPGPWRVSTHIVSDLKNGNHLNLAIDAKDEMRDYVCYVSAFDGMPAEANAKLIAAAPELLESLIDFLEINGIDPFQQNTEGYSKMTVKALSAIAKATGEKVTI